MRARDPAFTAGEAIAPLPRRFEVGETAGWMAGSLELGRQAFDGKDWAQARARLAGADLRDPEDLERLGVAAYLLGRDDESRSAFERAARVAERAGDLDRSAHSAVWLALSLLLQGDVARAGGWMARVERMLKETGRSCAASGLILVPRFLESLARGDVAAAEELADEMMDIGNRCDDRDVIAFGLLCRGQALLARTEVARGMTLLDEVMISVMTDELSPMLTGLIYCAVIEACVNVFDVRRAAEWTQALEAWCEAQPDLVPYRGQCLVHRSQVLQAYGTWEGALAEAERARERLSTPAHPALGLACYQQGELHRLRGEFAEAERAYRAAAEHGRDPSPGLALLRLAEGNVDTARAAVTRLLGEDAEPFSRPIVLAAAVDIMLGAGEVDAAQDAARELCELADRLTLPFFDALAAYARGRVALAVGDPKTALLALRQAYLMWNDSALVYEAARARVQIAHACDALGDADAAKIELDAARAVFTRLGARPDVSHVDACIGPSAPQMSQVLTDRELEVLRLVAAGKTNRAIAGELIISEHTVARHVQNIFRKLDLPSRAAATAYAFEHDLV